MLRRSFICPVRAKAKKPTTAASSSSSNKKKDNEIFTTRLTRQKFSSPVSLQTFQRPIQEQLRDHISRRKSVRGSARGVTDLYQYWISFPQALRQFNTMPKFGEEPAKVVNGATSVVSIDALKDAEMHFLLQSKPPWFSVGVGVYFDNQWHRILNPKMTKFLNPKREPRSLFIDVDACEDNGFTYKNVEPVQVKGICDRHLFCADQVEHPHKIFPVRGLALNPTTARRYSQPVHDVLVTASLLRGYVSPFWLTENQIVRFYRVGLDRRFANDFVEVPGRTAVLIKFSILPADVRREIVRQYPLPSSEERRGITVALDGGNWEVVMHDAILHKMTTMCHDPAEIELWVSLSMLRYLFEDWNKGAVTWTFTNSMSGAGAKELEHFLDSMVGKDNWLDLATMTMMKLYNAEATTNPRMILPQKRNIAISGGRQIHSRVLSLVMKHAFQHHFLSPIWLSPTDVLRVPGLAIKSGEKPLEISEKTQQREMLYNINDLEDESVESLLAKRPPPSDANTMHYTFVLSWQQVQSVARQKLLTAQKRPKNLWISHAEIVLNGFGLKGDAKPVFLTVGASGRQTDRTAARRGDGDCVRKLYNAEQTTDPVRVAALTLMRNA